MADLKPNLDIQKILISSPSLFYGAYESDKVLINLAWPTRQKNLKIKHTPYGSNQFVVAFKDKTKRQNDESRFLICCELDALFFHLYGITREDADYILVPFPIIKRKDMAIHGEYRTKRLILECYDAVQHSIHAGGPYQRKLENKR